MRNHPLLYLVSRSIVNGVKRMVSSPKRLLSFVAIIAYYFWVFLRPSFGGKPLAYAGMPSRPLPYNLPFPPVQVLNAVVFAAFTVLALPMLAQFTTLNRTMSAADVDVLFPTPVSPKLVMTLRILRDYLAALIVPAIFALFAWQPVRLTGIFAGLPHTPASGYIFKTAATAWLLLAIVYTTFGYACTLFVNRSDLASERNLKIINRTLTFVALGTIAYVTAMLVHEFSVEQAMRLAFSPILRVVYFIPWLGTIFALGPLTNPLYSVLSGVALLALAWLGYQIALSEVTWMYDQAAVRGFESMESIKMRKSGDMSLALAASARKGKIKAGRKTRLHSMRVSPTWAMVWREAVIQLRSFRSASSIFLVMALFYSLLPVIFFKFAPISNRHGEQLAGIEGGMFIGFQAMGLFMATMGAAANGYVELLKRTDLLKPLPFKPGKLMAVEVFAKSYTPVLVAVVCTLVAVAVDPHLAGIAFPYLLFAPTLAVLLSSCTLAVTLLFPEINDPTQRSFRGLMQMLGLAVCVGPGAVIYLLVAAYAHLPLLGAALGALVNAGIAACLMAAAGYLYLDFNPAE